MASPRKDGNTASLIKVFCNELQTINEEYSYYCLYDMNINGCTACRHCQNDWNGFNCSNNDDMHIIATDILKSDIIIFATPIYSWYCTPPMKAAMDRLVYGMNKYYGLNKGPAIWAGKTVAAVLTCGYPPQKGADLFIEGLKRYCKHSALEFAGAVTEHHKGYDTVFMDRDKAAHIKEFVYRLYRQNERL